SVRGASGEGGTQVCFGVGSTYPGLEPQAVHTKRMTSTAPIADTRMGNILNMIGLLVVCLRIAYSSHCELNCQSIAPTSFRNRPATATSRAISQPPLSLLLAFLQPAPL